MALDREMEKIWGHIKYLLEHLGASCAILAWMSSNRTVKFCSSGNVCLQSQEEMYAHFMRIFRSQYKSITGMDPLGLRSKCVESIMYRGDQPNKKVVALGWNNKIRSLQNRWQTLERSFDLPIFLSVLGSKSFCMVHPCDAEDMRQLRNLLGPAMLKTSFQKMPLTPLYIAPEIKRRQVKNQKLYGGMGNKRKRWNGEEVWAPGSLEWYEHEVELLRNMPVTPLCYSYYGRTRTLHWACADSRRFGAGETLHHRMLVRVYGEQGHPACLSCTCDTFHDTGACVHVQYVKKHYARLSNADFEDSSRVVKLSLRNGDLVGYYYKEAFVRQQTSRGLRCDLHESYSCEHVQYIQGIHQEDMVQNAADEDESDGGDIQMFKPVDEAMSVVERYIHDHPEAISVPFPYSKKIRDQARRIDMVGLDSWVCPAGQQYDPIDRLCPELPKHSCQCGQAYCESGIVPEERNAIVYLKPFKFSCERPLYALDCPNRRGGCRIPYIGVHDGLWRVSSTMVIDLDLIKTSIEESVFEGGASLESRCERLREQYSEAVEYGESKFEFMSASLFRSAVYNLGRCLKPRFQDFGAAQEPMNPLVCPDCKDCPKVLIMDGTSMTIRSNACFAAASTRSTDEKWVPRRHARIDRAFLNVAPQLQRTRQNRRKLSRLLREFSKWISFPRTKDTSFNKFNDMVELARFWKVAPFLEWAYRKGKTWDWRSPKRQALSSFLHSLQGDSPVVSYVSRDLFGDFQGSLASKRVSRSLIEKASQQSPVFGALLDLLNQGDGTAEIPEAWLPLLAELFERVTFTFDMKEAGYDVMRELGSSVEDPTRVSVADGSYLHSGVLSGLPRLRERPVYESDTKKDDEEVKDIEGDKAGCRHAFNKPGARTGGLFTILCEHGFVYHTSIIKSSEGRNDPFTFMTCYLREPPEVVIYDFACALQDYCLNRAPWFFMNTLFLVDAFHWSNHKACSQGYMIKRYTNERFRRLNSQVAEQNNSALKRLKSMLSRMSQKPFMAMLMLFMTHWNFKKLKKKSNRVERAARAFIRGL